MQKTYLLIGLYLFISITWASSFLFMRIGIPEFGARAFTEIRLIIAVFTLLPFLLIKRHLVAYKANWLKLSLLGIFCSGLPFLMFAFAAKDLNAGIGALVNSSTPIMTGIFAHLFFSDKLSKYQFFGLILGVFGVYVFVSDQLNQDTPMHAFLLGFGACVCYAVGPNFIKRFCQNIPAATITLSGLVASSIIALPLLFLYFPSEITQISLAAWFSVISIGAISTSIAMILFCYTIKNYGATKATVCVLLIPIFAIILGYVFLQESISNNELIGAAIIIASTAIYLFAPNKITMSKKKQENNTP